MLSLAFPAIDPIAISIGPIAIRWYALAYIAGLLLGWKYVVYYCTKTPNIMSKRDVDDLLFWATLGVILGGRLGYILFYNLEYYLENPANILKVWQGGMAFHGGFMGVILAIIAFARKRGISILAVLDAAAVATPIGLFLDCQFHQWRTVWPDHRCRLGHCLSQWRAGTAPPQPAL